MQFKCVDMKSRIESLCFIMGMILAHLQTSINSNAKDCQCAGVWAASNTQEGPGSIDMQVSIIGGSKTDLRCECVSVCPP